MVPLSAEPLTIGDDAPRHTPRAGQRDLGGRTDALFGGSTNRSDRMARNLDALRALQQVTTGEPLAEGEARQNRARELQDEIRRRSGEQDRPRDERDYLGRLLDRF